jgi:diaminohydroxyphosphoribosylaminopyrimidine deaminase/5-amino-6-(5-phosphoribosylamino)uracil reductase
MDDPALTTRLWPGHSPVRVIIDKDLRIPSAYKIYDGEVRSIILNRMKEGQEGTNRFVKPAGNSVDHFLASIYESGLQSVIVEGGRKLLQSFIDAGLWDEARVITGASRLSGGLPAPSLTRAQLSEEFSYSTDRIFIYKNIF